LVAAFLKDNHSMDEEDLRANVNLENGEIRVFHKDQDVTPAGFGRIASQTAKQVILQKIREAEDSAIAEEYEELIGTIVSGYIFRIDREAVILDIGKTQGIIPSSRKSR